MKLFTIFTMIVLLSAGASAHQPPPDFPDFFTGYMGYNCQPTMAGMYFTWYDLQQGINSGTVKSYYRNYSAPNHEAGPCNNITPQTHTGIEAYCNVSCLPNDEGSIWARAKQELLLEYYCPGPYCDLQANDIYEVDVSYYDYTVCKTFHWTVTFETKWEVLWEDSTQPEFVTEVVTHGENQSCWTELCGCGEDDDQPPREIW